MDDFLGWTTVVIVLAIPVAFVVIALVTRFRQREGDGGPSSGGLLGIDELFHPSGHDARIAWEAQRQILVPAPSPDRGPGVIEAGTRIVVEIPR
jgi:hypothetical protein